MSALARPMLPPVPVMTQTLSDNRPDISPRSRRRDDRAGLFDDDGDAKHGVVVSVQKMRKVLFNGSRRIRVPVSAAIAFASAGAVVGTLTSPTPVGGSSESIRCTSITGTDCIRSTG